jgi:hypothetical protein
MMIQTGKTQVAGIEHFQKKTPQHQKARCQIYDDPNW